LTELPLYGKLPTHGRAAEEGNVVAEAVKRESNKPKRRPIMKFRFEKNVLALLEGSIDIHIHSAPMSIRGCSMTWSSPCQRKKTV